MRNYHLPILLGLATTVAVYAPLPVQAEARVYEFVSGKESIRLDAEGFEVLESLGLSLASVQNTAVPAPGYTYAFDLLPRSSEPSVPGSTYTFSYDDGTGEFISLGGTIDFTGSVFFNVDTTRLALPPQLEVGDFSAEPSVNFDIRDTVNTGFPIFTLEPSAPVNVDLENQTVTLNFDMFASQEFSDFLVAAGASTPITGLKLGEIQGDRVIAEVAEVPESGSALAILTAASAALAVGKRRRSA
jgi:hypothetical protein